VAFDFNEELEKLESRYQFELLKKRDELKSLYLIMISTFVIMLAIVLLIFWMNAIRSRKKNNELQTAVRFLEKSQSDNARILKIVAHDLRSPMGGIVAIVGLMLEKKKELNEDQEQLLNLVNTSATQSLQLIDDLLNLKATNKEMKKEPTDMQELLDQCVDLLQFRANEKRLHIKLRTERVFCDVDKEKIWRVISNLITNSIKFSNEDSDILVQLKRNENYAIISVHDNGIGIPSAFREKIFNMEEEIKRSGTGGEKSFGLGLSISKQIMDAHNGKIWYESVQGKETTFYLQLPALP
jgi:signal transduction histidine kinase